MAPILNEGPKKVGNPTTSNSRQKHLNTDRNHDDEPFQQEYLRFDDDDDDGNDDHFNKKAPTSQREGHSYQYPQSSSMEITNNDEYDIVDANADDYNYDDEEIQRDATNDTVACIVYLALGFFMILFFGVTVAMIIIVGKYGFVVCIILSVLLFIVLLLGHVITHFMEQDRVLRPMKKKMRRWHAIATAVVVNELKNFHLDLNDHLLLTYDENYQDDNHDDSNYSGAGTHDRKSRRRWRGGGRGAFGIGGRKRGGPRSKLFGLLVQPLLKKKNGQARFPRRKKKNANDDVVAENVTPEDHAFV